MDIKLNDENDSVWINGPLTRAGVTRPFTENVSQRLKILLQTFEGEWFINLNHGIPWWSRILGQKPTKSAIDQILQQEILAENGVKELVSFTSSFANRTYSASFQVRVVNGEVTDTININPVN